MLMIDEDSFFKLIDNHLCGHYGFSMYRLPNDNDVHVIIQHSKPCPCFARLQDINDNQGFLMAPFIPSSNEPIVVIEPEYHVCGYEKIEDFFIHFPVNEHCMSMEQSPTIDISRGEYSVIFKKFIDYLHNGDVTKIVLARSTTCRFFTSLARYFFEAVNRYPHLMVYLCSTPQTGIWLGCTPETIIEGGNGNWRTMALAGTQLFSDNILWNQKNVTEQKVVCDFITDALRPIASDFSVSPTYTMQAGNLAHLRTDIIFNTTNNIHIGQLLERLHPTPAVCGFPVERAKMLITEFELTRRLYYSGIVGPLQKDSDSHLFVNLRCMRYSNHNVTYFAGGGIMPSSNENEEWNETEMKFSTIASSPYKNL